MNLEEIARFLEGSALFVDIDPEQLRGVAASAIVESHPPGTIIIKEDTPSDCFYLIVEGKVGIYREEKHLVLQSLSAGAVFGLLSIRDRQPLKQQPRQPLLNSISIT
jgi:signal-transduction protein with cAMP-binding, CBS, and nucleotidyltransferase domain